MDLNLPKLSGIEATRRITQASSQIAILVLTMFEDDDSVFGAMRAGARGYPSKARKKRRSSGRSASSRRRGDLQPAYRAAPGAILRQHAPHHPGERVSRIDGARA